MTQLSVRPLRSILRSPRLCALVAPALLVACGGGGGSGGGSGGGGGGDGGGGVEAASASAPSVELGLANAFTSPLSGNTAGDLTGTATVRFDVDVPAGQTASFVVEYSLDGGVVWAAAAVDEDLSGVAGPPAGVPAALAALEATWHIAADLGAGHFAAENADVGYPAVDVRVRVAGGEAGPPAQEPVEVNLLGVPIPSAPSGAARSGHVTALLPGGNLLVAGGADHQGALDAVEVAWRPEEIDQFEFAPKTPMGEARRGATATVLPNTFVLVAGGEQGGAPRASAELYDPADELFSSAADMHVARSGHAAVLLPDGRVLVMGGNNFSAEGTAEVYDRFADDWGLISLQGNYSEPAATRLTDGRVLVVGAPIGLELPSAELLELEDDGSISSVSVGPPLASRRRATATALPDGRVLIVGGRTPSGTLADPAAVVFDPAGTFTAVGAGNPLVPGYTFGGRYGHSAAAMGNGSVIITGGRGSAGALLPQTEFFLPLVDAFTPASPLPEARADHVMDVLAGGVVVVTGGKTDGSTGEAAVDTTVTLLGSGGLNFEPVASDAVVADMVGSDAKITFRLTDAEGDDARVRIEWTATPTDPLSWRSITQQGGGDGLVGLAASAAGVDHEVTWDAAGDGVFAGGSLALVSIKLTPMGAVEGVGVVTSGLLVSP